MGDVIADELCSVYEMEGQVSATAYLDFTGPCEIAQFASARTGIYVKQFSIFAR